MCKLRFTMWSIAISLLIGATAATAADAPLKVGAAAPEFSLVDQQQRKVTLEALLKEKKAVVLVFYRSADW